MRKIKRITVLDNYILKCEFEDYSIVFTDIKIFLDSEVFQPLRNYSLFKNVENHGLFVSWLNGSVDLSADTLWHNGTKEIPAFSF